MPEFREQEETLAERLQRMERELKRANRRLDALPGERWRAVEIDGELRYVNKQTGTMGTAIGQT